jgi:hypothetical protein
VFLNATSLIISPLHFGGSTIGASAAKALIGMNANTIIGITSIVANFILFIRYTSFLY